MHLQIQGVTPNQNTSMASGFAPDAWEWISNLPPPNQWNTKTISLCICTSTSMKPSLNLSVTKSIQNKDPFVSFSICADFHIPIALWTSSPIHPRSSNNNFLDDDAKVLLFQDMVLAVLSYGPGQNSFRLPAVRTTEAFKDVFNLAFLSLAFLICIYEAPYELRSGWLDAYRLHLSSGTCRQASKHLVRVLGSNLEEQWMRSINLAVTNWISELQTSYHSFRTPSPLFSYAISTSGLWKVQLYCPIIAMTQEDPSNMTQDEHLMFSLKYQQLEGVIQLAYKVNFNQNWIDIIVAVDNVRCDVKPLVSDALMDERGCGAEEKHFPSGISLQLTPTLQSDILSLSVGKSSDNPTQEIGREKGFEGSFDPPNTYLGLTVSATETITTSTKPWKFEQSAYGSSANLEWFLHDGVNGREVFSSKPSKFALLQPRSWFRNRYSTSYRPFTKQGGVIFAGDEYGDSVWWKVCRGALGKTMEWEIKGKIWLTYWPNKQRTFYSETRKLQFKELLYLPVPVS